MATMWSVWYLPKPGLARIESRTASVAGFALAETVNSRWPLVMQRLYRPVASAFLRGSGSSAGVRGDERWIDHFAFDGTATHVHTHPLPVGDVGGGVDERQRDTDFQ